MWPNLLTTIPLKLPIYTAKRYLGVKPLYFAAASNDGALNNKLNWES